LLGLSRDAKLDILSDLLLEDIRFSNAFRTDELSEIQDKILGFLTDFLVFINQNKDIQRLLN